MTPGNVMKERAGFTLLEILVAIMIFGVIMLTVFSSFRSFAVSSAMIRENSAISGAFDSFTKVITRDFISLRIALEPEYSKPVASSAGLSSGVDDSEKDRFRFVGDETEGADRFSRIRFASLSHLPFGKGERVESGVARIIYYVREREKRGEFDLCRSDTLNDFSDFEGSECDPVICRNVTEFRVTYIDVEGEEHESWDSESDEYRYATPVSIRVDIRFRYDDDSSPASFTAVMAMPLFREPAK